MKPTWGSERSSRNVARLWGYRAYEEDRERIRLWPGRLVVKPGWFYLSRYNRKFSKCFSNLADRFSASPSTEPRCSVVRPDRSSNSPRYSRYARRSCSFRSSFVSVVAHPAARALWTGQRRCPRLRCSNRRHFSIDSFHFDRSTGQRPLRSIAENFAWPMLSRATTEDWTLTRTDCVGPAASRKTRVETRSRERSRVWQAAGSRIFGRHWEYVEPIPARRVTYKDHNTNIQACKNNNKLIYSKMEMGRYDRW